MSMRDSLLALAEQCERGWLLLTLSEIAGDGMSFCKLANTRSPTQETAAVGGKTLALTLCAAALRAHAEMEAKP